MADEYHSLTGFFVTMFVNHRCEEGSEGIGMIGSRVLWRKLGKTAAWKIDGQTWGQVDETGEERLELGSTTTKSVDEN